MSFLHLLPSAVIPIALAVLLLIYLFGKFTTRNRCPACHDKYPDRTPRPWLFKSLLSFLPLRAYQCQACGRNYYLLGRPSSPIDKQTLTFTKDAEPTN